MSRASSVGTRPVSTCYYFIRLQLSTDNTLCSHMHLLPLSPHCRGQVATRTLSYLASAVILPRPLSTNHWWLRLSTGQETPLLTTCPQGCRIHPALLPRSQSTPRCITPRGSAGPTSSQSSSAALTDIHCLCCSPLLLSHSISHTSTRPFKSLNETLAPLLLVYYSWAY